MNLRKKHRNGSSIHQKGIILSSDNPFEHDEWVEEMSERAELAASWRRKQRKKRREYRDHTTDH